MANSRLEAGRQIGRFRVVAFIAEGGQAQVYEVEDPRFPGDRLALKLLKREAAAGADLERFRSEILSQRLIKSTNLITVYEWGEDEETGCPFYVMDLLHRGTLADVQLNLHPDPDATVSGEQVLDVIGVCEVVLGALSALDAMHRARMVHRDIKPQNIFLDEAGNAILGDLGIAKRPDEPGVTTPGFAPGTVLYMSPEQMMGEPLGPESDIFSMGLVLYRVLAGRTVYDEVKNLDSTNSHAVQRHLWDLQGRGQEFQFEFPREIPDSVQRVVRRACSMRPADRYRSARSMSEALKAAIREIELGPISGDTRGIPWPWLGGVAAALVIGVGLWFGWRYIVPSELGPRLEQARLTRLQAADARVLVEQSGGEAVAPLLAQADRLIREASDDLVDAEMFIDAGRDARAQEKLESAEKSFAQACDELSERNLSAAAAAASRDVLASLGAVHPIAEQLFGEDWQALQAGKGEFQAEIAATGCAGAEQRVARLSNANAFEARIQTLNGRISERLPQVAEASLGAASAAAGSARSAEVDFKPYRDALAQGGAELEKAEAELGRARSSGKPEQFLAADTAARAAQDAFQRAEAAAGAHAARAEARELESEVRRAGISPGLQGSALQAAESAFSGADWAAAGAGFTETAGVFRGMLADSQAAREQQQRADAARVDAVREGVAGDPLRQADDKYNAAKGRLRGQEFAAAETDFGESADLYRSAAEDLQGLGEVRERAVRAIEAAIASERQARQAKGLGTEYASALDSGAQALQAAQKAREDARYDEVQAQTEEAQKSFASALRIAPASLAKSAAEKKIEQARAKGLGETLWERDLRAAERDYADRVWDQAALGFEQVGERVSRLVSQSDGALSARDGAARAREAATRAGAPDSDLFGGDNERSLGDEELERGNFDQARGHYDRARTQYAAYSPPNRPPSLALRPAGERLERSTGERIDFSASARDPDGDRAEIRFELDGQVVARGSSYRFDAVEPGSHTLKVIASDGKGSTDAATRTIVVTKAAPKPPPVSTATTPTAERTPPPVSTPSSAGGLSPADAEVVLAQYKKALESKDLNSLRQLVVLDQAQIEDIQNVFWDCPNLKVELTHEHFQVRGDKATLELTQTNRGCMLTDGSQNRYSATLWQRAGGDWKMTLSPAN